MKTIQVKVLLTESFEETKEWKLEIPTMEMSPNETAEFVYEISNSPIHILPDFQQEILEKFPRHGLRSVSVGDVLLIEDTEDPRRVHILTVENAGFKSHSF